MENTKYNNANALGQPKAAPLVPRIVKESELGSLYDKLKTIGK